MPLPEITPGKGQQCVEPTAVIRRNHMDFLKHTRDETVHGGIRGRKHSLVKCVDCHVSRNADGGSVPINAPGEFCESCHRYAAVSIDCFGCHATTPDSGSTAHNAAAVR